MLAGSTRTSRTGTFHSQARLREARDHGVALASAQAGMESALGISAASGLPFQKVELEIPG